METKIANTWAVSLEDARDIMARMDVNKWLGGDTLAAITHAGTVEGGGDQSSGHAGYWLRNNEFICQITNGDPVWAEWSEAIADDCGLPWGDIEEAMLGHEVA